MTDCEHNFVYKVEQDWKVFTIVYTHCKKCHSLLRTRYEYR